MRHERLLQVALEQAEAQRTALAAGDIDAYLAVAPAYEAASAAVIEAGDPGPAGRVLLQRIIASTLDSQVMLQGMMDDTAGRLASMRSTRRANAAYYAGGSHTSLQVREG